MATKKKKPEPQVEVATEPVVGDKVINVKCDESPRFSFEQLVQSNRYRKYAYLLDVKLDKDATYTLAEVDKILSEMV